MVYEDAMAVVESSDIDLTDAIANERDPRLFGTEMEEICMREGEERAEKRNQVAQKEIYSP
jgi:hypothetical protein